MRDEETSLVETTVAPSPPALAWDEERPEVAPARDRGWLVPMVIALVAAALVVVAAVLMLAAKQPTLPADQDAAVRTYCGWK